MAKKSNEEYRQELLEEAADLEREAAGLRLEVRSLGALLARARTPEESAAIEDEILDAAKGAQSLADEARRVRAQADRL